MADEYPKGGYSCEVELTGIKWSAASAKKAGKGKVAVIAQSNGVTLFQTEFVNEQKSPLWNITSRCVLRSTTDHVSFQLINEQAQLIARSESSALDLHAHHSRGIPATGLSMSLFHPSTTVEYAAVVVKLSMSLLAESGGQEDAFAAQLCTVGVRHGDVQVTYDDMPQAIDFSDIFSKLSQGEPIDRVLTPHMKPASSTSSPALSALSDAAEAPAGESSNLGPADGRKKSSKKKASSEKESKTKRKSTKKSDSAGKSATAAKSATADVPPAANVDVDLQTLVI